MTAKGKHSPPGKGNIYAKANEVIVKITGDDTAQTFEVVEENCKPGFQSRAHYHIKAYETFYVFDGSAEFRVGDSGSLHRDNELAGDSENDELVMMRKNACVLHG